MRETVTVTMVENQGSISFRQCAARSSIAFTVQHKAVDDNEKC